MLTAFRLVCHRKRTLPQIVRPAKNGRSLILILLIRCFEDFFHTPSSQFSGCFCFFHPSRVIRCDVEIFPRLKNSFYRRIKLERTRTITEYTRHEVTHSERGGAELNEKQIKQKEDFKSFQAAVS